MDPITLILSSLAGWAATGLVALIKKWTGFADLAIGGFLKKLQPLVALGITLALKFLLPVVCGWLALTAACPTSDQLINAPVGTVVGIVLAELVQLVKKWLTGDKSLPATPTG
jgi:hypothetical protein